MAELSDIWQRLETASDPGSVEVREDRLVLNKSAGIVGVLDGTSETHAPPLGPLVLHGETGGQLVVRTVEECVLSASIGQGLNQVIAAANGALEARLRDISERAEFRRRGLDLKHAGDRPAAAGAFFKVRPGQGCLEVAAWGDCLALWGLKNGGFGGTRNQVFAHDMEMRREMAGLLAKHAGDRGAMWREIQGRLRELREARVNRPDGYGMLNGQAAFLELVEYRVLELSAVRCVLVVTDGMVHCADTADAAVLARAVISFFMADGLPGVLAAARARQAEERDRSHVDFGEATAAGVVLEGCNREQVK